MKNRIIVSVTTYPKRFEKFKIAIQHILNQTLKYDILRINIDDNLSEDDIKMYKDYISSLNDNRIELKVVDCRYRSANKLLPTIKDYPDDVVITTDDDMTIKEHILESLYNMHLKLPMCIITHEINPVLIDENYNVDIQLAFMPRLYEISYGKYLSNCCLFPPHVFDNTDVFNLEKFENFKYHDELWFWIHSTINGIKVFCIDDTLSFQIDSMSSKEFDETALSNINGNVKKNIEYNKLINEIYHDKLKNTFENNEIIFYITKKNYTAIYLGLPYIFDVYKNYKITFIMSDELSNSEQNWFINLSYLPICKSLKLDNKVKLYINKNYIKF